MTSHSNDLVLAHEMAEETPSAALLWDALVQAMQHPAAGTPHRPTELQVRPDERWESLKPHLDEISVGLTVTDELDQIEVVFNEMCAQVCGKPKPGLLDMPGVKPDQVGRFYEAAAHFFRLAPWKKVGYEAVIKVECDKFQSGPWYALLMGQSGLTTGLTLYEDRLAPWKKVGYESVIKVQCDKFQSGPWYALLMGQSGLTTGLTLYEP